MAVAVEAGAVMCSHVQCSDRLQVLKRTLGSLIAQFEIHQKMKILSFTQPYAIPGL